MQGMEVYQTKWKTVPALPSHIDCVSIQAIEIQRSATTPGDIDHVANGMPVNLYSTTNISFVPPDHLKHVQVV